MKNSNKLLVALLLLSIIFSSFSISVSANAPASADSLTVDFLNLPQEAIYADLLIQIDADDPKYIDFQANDFVKEPSDADELVNYSKDGYRSFSFHYKNAVSGFLIEKYVYGETTYYSANFCRGAVYREFLTQYEDLLANYRDIKIVLLDENLDIITVSTPAQLPKDSSFINFYGYIEYNVADNTVNVESSVNSFFIVFGGAISLLFIAVSINTEVLCALCFKIWGRKIVTLLIVNICTQVLMRILYLVLPFTYLIETVILEFLVYSSEFLIYKHSFKDVSTAKIVVYTVVANTLSLFLGIFLDCCIFA